jgi:hypothetical protein
VLTEQQTDKNPHHWCEKLVGAKQHEHHGKMPGDLQSVELAQMHADYVIPWSRDGKTIPNNDQMLCRDCNLKKGNL